MHARRVAASAFSTRGRALDLISRARPLGSWICSGRFFLDHSLARQHRFYRPTCSCVVMEKTEAEIDGIGTSQSLHYCCGYVVEANEPGNLRRVRIRMARSDDDIHAPSPRTDGEEKALVADDGAKERTKDHAIPETVLQYERQMRKIRAADRAGGAVTREEHLRVVHEDDFLVVVNKPSGVLCVPGVNNNPSILTVVHDTYGCESGAMDSMIVHRLDMDTSGLVVFARTNAALRGLHESFRERKVEKSYEALLCGHLNADEGVIDLPLQRDHRYPPFMRVSTPQSEMEAQRVVKDLQHNGWKKIIRKNPKPSQTEFKVVSREIYSGKYPATRVTFSPITGRTHQLRVHSSAIGHPIIADPAYGIMGEAAPNGGFEESRMDGLSPHRASMALQGDINRAVSEEDRRMCLHAKELSFSHPITGVLMKFEALPPF